MTEVFAQPTWAVVELFGHNVIAGEISSVTVAGTEMLRVDVPEVEGASGFTKFFGGSAIYAVTPVDEATALMAVRRAGVRPIQMWVVPDQHEQLAAPAEDEEHVPF